MSNNRNLRKRRRSSSNSHSNKRRKDIYINDLNKEYFQVNSIKDLIKLGLQHYDNPIFKRLFKLVVPLIKIDRLIGMDSIKNQLSKQIIYFVQDFHKHDNDGSMLHSVIYGPPGCGKTHVASLIGEIYQGLGFISTNNITLGKRTDFIADYLGQTANKTKKFLEKATPGILIIDEIYSLSSGIEDHDSYAKECIDTINQYLSENKKELLCIVIGYKDDVDKCFFALNKGLERRFPFRYTIEEYKPNELTKIFEYQVNQNKWEVSEPSLIRLKEIIETNKDLFKNFGGDTDNLFFHCKTARSIRLFGQVFNKDKYTIELEDINNGFIEFQKAKKETMNDNNKPPNGMYI